MKFFTSAQISEIDRHTIQNEPILSVNLMERAANAVCDWIISKYSSSSFFRIFAGPGNNGGDALAIARILSKSGFSVALHLVRISDKLSPDAETNLQRFIETVPGKLSIINSIRDFPEISSDEIIIDGLFGSGLNRPLNGLSAQVVKKINHSGAFVIAIDIPSGLFGENNSENIPDNIINASSTLTFQFPKLSFFFSENYKYTGDWEVLPIGLNIKIIDQTYSPYHLIDKKLIQNVYNKRSKFSHKGDFGHGLLIAGSYEKTGAALLAAEACLRSGIGLLTVHIPEKSALPLQSYLPEAMLSIDKSEKFLSEIPEPDKFNSIAIGPGIGLNSATKDAVSMLIKNSKKPIIIDADALNIISENKLLLNKIPANSILTPHIKEFSRLFGTYDDSYKRLEAQIKFSSDYKIIIVLKGAHTSVTTPDGKCYLNSTGNPGMATGGSGDVLTGIILSLLSQGYSPEDSAFFAVYLHGLAGDFASEKMSQESLIASDITKFLCCAFLSLNEPCNE